MTLQSQHQENTYPDNYFPPNALYSAMAFVISVSTTERIYNNNNEENHPHVKTEFSILVENGPNVSN